MPSALRKGQMTKEHSGEWTHQLFVQRPHLFLPFLEAGRAKGKREAAELAKLYRKFGVRPNDRILDLCCGIGRVAVPLAKLGYRVIGVDIAPEYVKRARENAMSSGVVRRTKFVVGDYRDISSALTDEEPLSGILNTYTSMGYYGREVDRKTFAQLAQHTAPGGIFILKTINRDWLIHHFERRGWDMVGGVLLLQERKLDLERSYMVNRWEYFRVMGMNLKPEGVYTVDHRVYSPSELKELMESTGWKVRSMAATFRGEPIDLRSADKSEVVLIGQRGRT